MLQKRLFKGFAARVVDCTVFESSGRRAVQRGRRISQPEGWASREEVRVVGELSARAAEGDAVEAAADRVRLGAWVRGSSRFRPRRR